MLFYSVISEKRGGELHNGIIKYGNYLIGSFWAILADGFSQKRAFGWADSNPDMYLKVDGGLGFYCVIWHEILVFCSIAADKGKDSLAQNWSPTMRTQTWLQTHHDGSFLFPWRRIFLKAFRGWDFSWTFFFFEPFLNSNDIPQR